MSGEVVATSVKDPDARALGDVTARRAWLADYAAAWARKRSLPVDQAVVEFFAPLPERVQVAFSYRSTPTSELKEAVVQTRDPLALSSDPADRKRYEAQLRLTLAERDGVDAAKMALYLGEPPPAPRWTEQALTAAVAEVKARPGLEAAVATMQRVVQNVLAYPDDPKYRSLKMSALRFDEDLGHPLSRKALACLGFLPSGYRLKCDHPDLGMFAAAENMLAISQAESIACAAACAASAASDRGDIQVTYPGATEIGVSSAPRFNVGGDDDFIGPPVGASVVVRGLESAAHLNGRFAKILGLAPGGDENRYTVEIQPIGTDTPQLAELNGSNMLQRIQVERLRDGASGLIAGAGSEAASYAVRPTLGRAGSVEEWAAGETLLPVGTCALVTGLVGSAHFNGKWARVVGVDRAAGRYIVQCATKNRNGGPATTAKVRFGNLEL